MVAKGEGPGIIGAGGLVAASCPAQDWLIAGAARLCSSQLVSQLVHRCWARGTSCGELRNPHIAQCHVRPGKGEIAPGGVVIVKNCGPCTKAGGGAKARLRGRGTSKRGASLCSPRGEPKGPDPEGTSADVDLRKSASASLDVSIASASAG